MSFSEHLYIFLLEIYTGVEFLCPGVLYVQCKEILSKCQFTHSQQCVRVLVGPPNQPLSLESFPHLQPGPLSSVTPSPPGVPTAPLGHLILLRLVVQTLFLASFIC